MTRPRLPIKPVVVSPCRRGGERGTGAAAGSPPLGPADVAELAHIDTSPDDLALGQPWLLNSREVSALLGIGRTKVFQMMASNELPVVRIGRCIRVPRSGLAAWIRNQSNCASPWPPAFHKSANRYP